LLALGAAVVTTAALPAFYLQNARADLAEEFEALKRPDQAAKFRAELGKQ